MLSSNKEIEQSYPRDARTHLCVVFKKLNSKTPDRQQVTIFNSSVAARGILGSKTEEENIE